MSNYAALDTHAHTHAYKQSVKHTHRHRELSWTNRYTHTICTHTHRETLTKSIGSSCDGNWDGDCDWERDCDCDFDYGRDSSWDYIESSGGSRWTVLVARLLQTDGRSWRKAAKRPQHILKDVRLSGQPECHLSHERQRERAPQRENAGARESVREREREFTRTQGFYQWAAHVPKINACDFIFIPDSLPAPSSKRAQAAARPLLQLWVKFNEFSSFAFWAPVLARGLAGTKINNNIFSKIHKLPDMTA